LLLLAACQHDGSNRPTVSLEEAKQITAEFSGGSFVPTPRSISDIIKLLDEQPPSDPADLKKRLAMIAERPSADATGAALARFHFQRGRMAAQLGLDAQALAHLRRAGELADAGEALAGRRDIYSELAWIEIIAGNYLDGIRAMRKAAGIAPNSLGTRGGLTRMYAEIGDLDKASKYAAETRSRIAQSAVDQAPRGGRRCHTRRGRKRSGFRRDLSDLGGAIPQHRFAATFQ
jgi:tetratricopeptide (TPR) repeat protein